MLPPLAVVPVSIPFLTVMPESVAAAWLSVKARPALFASTITASRLPLAPRIVIGLESVSEFSVYVPSATWIVAEVSPPDIAVSAGADEHRYPSGIDQLAQSGNAPVQ